MERHSRAKTYTTKTCELCKSDYAPTNPIQRWCKVCVPNNKLRPRVQKYGVSNTQYELMIENQKNSSAICEVSFETLPSTKVVIDHCHETGQVRGIVCQGCNIKLAALDNRDWFERAQKYRGQND